MSFTEYPAEVLDLDPYIIGEADGLFHVTVARDRVLAEGLRSRRQLNGQVQGLGGGANNQAPDKISLTWSSGKAEDIRSVLELAVRAARGEVAPSEVFQQTAARFGVYDWFGPSTIRCLRELGAPESILGDEMLQGIEDWLDAEIIGGQACYELLQALDDAMEADFDRTEQLPDRIGLTAPWERIAVIDPGQIAVLRLAVAVEARPEVVLEEAELRFHPDEVRVLGVAFEEVDTPDAGRPGPHGEGMEADIGLRP